jgi:predicted MFS family arabinose efflux permease
MTGATLSGRVRGMRAVGAVFANHSVRDAQIALAVARAVDLAQLVVVSAFLFGRGGAALVATYGVVRAIVPALGVPVVTALGCRLGHGALLRMMGIVAAIGSLATAAVAASRGPTIGVLAGAGVVGVALGCFRPVISAALPALVRSPAELLASNAATGFFDGASTLLGPVLGSIVAVVFGVPALLVVTGGAMLGAGLVAGRLPIAAAPERATREHDGPDRIAEYVAGARELAANRGARLVTLLGTAQTFIRGAMSVIVVVFAVDVVRTGDTGVGALYGAMGVGGLVGLPVAMVVVDRVGVHRSLAMGLATWGTPLAVCALVPTPSAALLLFGIIGVGNGVVDVGYDSAMQRLVAERVLTRVLGVVEAMFQAGLAAGAVVGAVLLDHLGPRHALVVVGIVLPALAAAATPRLSSFDRTLGGRDKKIALLRRLSCFAPLPMTALDQLADRVARVGFASGQIVNIPGHPADSYMLVDEDVPEVVDVPSGAPIHPLLQPVPAARAPIFFAAAIARNDDV